MQLEKKRVEALKNQKGVQSQDLVHLHRTNQGVVTPCSAWYAKIFEKILMVVFFALLLLTACCPPAINTTQSLPETAFTATFLGFSANGQYLVAKPERSSGDMQLIYNSEANLVVGQKMYVVGRLEGNLVYVSDLKPL
jgi:hypothetical protein